METNLGIVLDVVTEDRSRVASPVRRNHLRCMMKVLARILVHSRTSSDSTGIGFSNEMIEIQGKGYATANGILTQSRARGVRRMANRGYDADVRTIHILLEMKVFLDMPEQSITKG